jgi:methylthioribose-1-phosphate isomerase
MEAIRFHDDVLYLLDQTVLPGREVWLPYSGYRPVCDAIARLVVRGAPAIGVAAAYAYFLAAKASDCDLADCAEAKADLDGTRPTALNLKWATDRMYRLHQSLSGQAPGAVLDALRAEAIAIHDEDKALCRRISQFGAAVVPEHARILTHCNAGALATGGMGTALGVIREAYRQGKVDMVYADETRPLLQGARLTAYELYRDGIPVTLQPDSAAASLLASGGVDLIIVGADRICRNGDFANKVGTLSLAILAKHFGVPFYTAAPYSTIDTTLSDGSQIIIEQRSADEVRAFGGTVTAPPVPVHNPAFDVTPHELVTGIITDQGVQSGPFVF